MLMDDCALFQVLEGHRLPLPEHTPSELKHLVEKQCWSKNPEDRWTMKQVIRHLLRERALDIFLTGKVSYIKERAEKEETRKVSIISQSILINVVIIQ